MDFPARFVKGAWRWCVHADQSNATFGNQSCRFDRHVRKISKEGFATKTCIPSVGKKQTLTVSQFWKASQQVMGLKPTARPEIGEVQGPAGANHILYLQHGNIAALGKDMGWRVHMGPCMIAHAQALDRTAMVFHGRVGFNAKLKSFVHC